MADVSAHSPVFSRGSSVLDYWLVHAEGLTVQPLGARVERVVLGPPVGHAEELIVRSRMTRRRRSIPAGSIAAVEPSAGLLLLDTPLPGGLRIPRPPAERIAAVRATAHHGGQVVLAHSDTAARRTRAGTLTAAAWLRPRAVRTSLATARHVRLAATRTTEGVVWLTPRVAAGARTAAVTTAQLTLEGAAIVARVAARAGRELGRLAVAARVSLQARRARSRDAADD